MCQLLKNWGQGEGGGEFRFKGRGLILAGWPGWICTVVKLEKIVEVGRALCGGGNAEKGSCTVVGAQVN